MKILIIPSFSSDYLQDSIYLGLKDLYGKNVECIHNCSYLFKNTVISPHLLWGRGFTYTKILDDSLNIIADNVLDRINENYYDLIIYSFISRNDSMFSEVMKITNGKKVVLVNGEDEYWRFEHYNPNVIYFKRELITKNEPNIFPIGYSIHKSKLFFGDKEIKKNFSDSIPSMENCTPTSSSKYIFDNEGDYYMDYQVSKFGITKKKGGWDSMRHYEILSNKCIPIFENIDSCPNLTLTKLPKGLLSYINKNYDKIGDEEYSRLNRELFEHTQEYLTSDKMMRYMLDISMNK